MDTRQYAPATQRNREPILQVLKRVLPADGNILEIASGTGEHAVFFASNFPHCRWIPSDTNPLCRDSIVAWRDYNSVGNLDNPLDIDASTSQWSIETRDISINAIVNINMIHISPWSSCLGLMAGAKRILTKNGILYLYGPFKRNGEHTAPSNEAFDKSLRDRNSAWGVRNLEDVVELAATAGLHLQEVIPMPANNFSVVFVFQNL